MNKFYSANGNFENIDIIEHLDVVPPTNISIISYMIENENMKNRISVLESNIIKLEGKINESRMFLPYNNNKSSTIISKSSNDWSSIDGNIVMHVFYDNKYEYIPQIFVELAEKNNSNMDYKIHVSDIDNESFKCKLIVDNLELNNLKDENGKNVYNDKMDFVKQNLSLNYMIIG